MNIDQPTEPRPTFDAAICQELKSCLQGLLLKYPELRSVTAVADYYHDLNDANLNQSVWLSQGGAAIRPDEIFGSLMQMLKVANFQLHRATQLVDHLREQATLLGIELVESVPPEPHAATTTATTQTARC